MTSCSAEAEKHSVCNFKQKRQLHQLENYQLEIQSSAVQCWHKQYCKTEADINHSQSSGIKISQSIYLLQPAWEQEIEKLDLKLYKLIHHVTDEEDITVMIKLNWNNKVLLALTGLFHMTCNFKPHFFLTELIFNTSLSLVAISKNDWKMTTA